MATRTTSRSATPQQERPLSATPPLLWGLVIFVFVILLFFSGYFLYYSIQDCCRGPWTHQDVEVALNAPKYLSAGDVGEASVTVVNEKSVATVITATVSYSGTLLCMTGDDESHVVGFGALAPQERATARIRMQFPLCLDQLPARNWSNRPAQFDVWLTVGDQPPYLLDTISFPVTPIPRARTLGKISGSLLAGLSVWLLKEIWEQAKKAERPIAAKGKVGK